MALKNGCTGQELIDTVNQNSQNVKKLIEDKFNVGDIRTSIHSDLGDKYLLCNGEEFQNSEYPELYDLFDLQLGSNNCEILDCEFNGYVASSLDKYAPIQYIGGYYMQCPKDGYVLYYTKDFLGEWNTISFSANLNGFISYENGYYFVPATGGIIYYAADLEGSWEQSDVCSSEATIMSLLGKVVYYNGNYLIAAKRANRTGSTIYGYYETYYYTSSLDGSWTNVGYYDTYYENANAKASFVKSLDGSIYLYHLGHKYSSCTDITKLSSWTSISISPSYLMWEYIDDEDVFLSLAPSSMVNRELTSIQYGAVYSYYDSDTPHTQYGILGSYKIGEFTYVASISSGVLIVSRYKLVNSQYVLLDNFRISGLSHYFYNCLFQKKNDKGYIISDKKIYEFPLAKFLPIVSHENSYTYIKAKE